MELGRFMIGDFGSFYTRVVDKKIVKEKNFLILESGINHLLRPLLVLDPFPVFTDEKTTSYDLRGPLCTSLDSLQTLTLPDKIEIGDWLVFSKTGAYGFTESMPFFLCHPIPAEVARVSGQNKIVRPILNPEQYLY